MPAEIHARKKCAAIQTATASAFWAHSGHKRKLRLYFIDSKDAYLVPGGGVEPPREVVSADFESAASASNYITFSIVDTRR